MTIALQIVAAIACFLMAMLAARDAETARLREKPIAFVIFALFAMLFAASFVWVIFL